jgi:hypothetical protein
MYTDFAQWARVRELILLKGKTRTAVSASEHIGISMIRKMLAYEKPPGFRYKEGLQNGRPKVHNDIVERQIADNHRLPEASRLSTTALYQQMQRDGYKGSLGSVFHYRKIYEDADEGHLWQTVQHIVRRLPDEEGAKFISSLFPRGTLTGSSHAAVERRRKIHNKSTALAKPLINREYWLRAEWDRWLADLEKQEDTTPKFFQKQTRNICLINCFLKGRPIRRLIGRKHCFCSPKIKTGLLIVSSSS